jgi:pyruvate dehydrogenase E1 component alpha subunit
LSDLYREQEMRTPTHFGIGQEAIAAGVCQGLRTSDAVYSHHRCHNHYLACGGDLVALVAELYGRENGCSRGRGGSVHLTDRKTCFVVSSAIVGQTIPLAVGSALSFTMDGARDVAVAFLGDAAPEEGVFYESLNFAAIHRLPVLFICENNFYSVEAPLSVRQPAGTTLSARANAFSVEAQQIDGNDVFAVHATATDAVARLRDGAGPVFLECTTYRWREHVGPMFDDELGRTYRSRQELETWMARCPVATTRQRLIDEDAASEADCAAWEEQARSEIDAAVTEAQAGPWPDPAHLFDHVY